MLHDIALYKFNIHIHIHIWLFFALLWQFVNGLIDESGVLCVCDGRTLMSLAHRQCMIHSSQTCLTPVPPALQVCLTTFFISRRNCFCSANDTTYSCTFLLSVVCLSSVAFVHPA